MSSENILVSLSSRVCVIKALSMYFPPSHASPDPIYPLNHVLRVDDVIIINRIFVQETWQLMPVTL